MAKRNTIMKTIFTINLVITLIISFFLISNSFLYYKASFGYSQNMQVNYLILISGIILAVLSIVSFIGLIKLRNWGRILGIVENGLISSVLTITIILFILNPVTSHGVPQYFSNLGQIIVPLIITLFYIFNLFYLLSKKVKEAFN